MPVSWTWQQATLLTFAAIPLGLRAERAYRALPTLPACEVVGGPLPKLSIIVPARNEAENLRFLLPSLCALQYSGSYEIIVVDDGSADGTGTVAAEFGARVIRLDSLPSGWLGKPHACHEGALAATGDWLLFTDADTIHSPGSAGAAVRYAVDRGSDGLSLFLEPSPHSAAERLALMTAFAGLFAGWPRGRSHASGRSAASRADMLNGQYILLSRQAYFDTGGFEAVANQPLEDLALGHLLAHEGFQTPILHGGDAATVRMYADDRAMWRGLSRLGSGSLRWSGLGSIASILFITSLMSPLITGAGVVSGRLRPWWLPVTWMAATASMVPWARRSGSAAWALLAPVAALMVQAAAVWGLVNRLLGRGLQWKGRRV